MKQFDYDAVKRLQNDDKKAFNTLYGQYNHKIYLNALKFTKDSDTAKDIVQEVFITLWEKRQSIDPSKPLLNWIFVVSYHKSIDFLKKSLKIIPVSEDLLPYTFQLEPEESMRREHQWKLIERAINELSPQKRKVFEICKLQGKTYAHAAQQLQISKYTVKEYLSAAMKNVKEFVEKR